MSHLTRLGALVATGALTTSGLVASLAAPAQAVIDDRPATIGAGWLEDELTNGIFGGDCSYDCGSTIDAGFALSAAGDDAAAGDVADALGAKVVNGYAEADESDYSTDPPTPLPDKGIYAGPLAKAIVFAQTTGITDLTTWSGRDLVADLEGVVSSDSAITGRIVDDSFYGSYANNIGQAFAVAALHTASSSKAADALDFLLGQQCAAGYFRLNPAALDAVDPGQTCDEGVSSNASPADPDTTSTAVRMLIPQKSDPTVAAALDKAEAWLLGVQHADGSFGGGTSTEVSNANSTGLAGWALGELGDDVAAAKAASWVRAHQADEVAGCANSLTDETGAIGYDDAAVAAGRTDGITTALRDQWRRSTSQSLAVLEWAPSATGALDLTGPTGFVRAGRAATFTMTGAAPGEKVCVTGIGTARRVVASAAGSASFSLVTPAGTASRAATATVRSGSSASYVVKVLGPKILKVVPARRTKHRGTKLRVVVSGLAPGEHVRLRYRGVTKRTGVADPTGHFRRVIRVGHRLGRARIVAWGEFSAIRHGRAVIRVVR